MARSEPIKGGVNKSGSFGTPSVNKKETGGEAAISKAGSNFSNEVKGRGVRNLPYVEYVKRREEGRCFHCGGLYSPGHCCPEQSIKITILAEGEEEDEEGENRAEEEPKPMELSFFSAGGLTQPRTMKLQGWVNGRRVLVLIDSGANHNFIAKRIATELDLPVEETPAYKVCLGDGRRKEAQGCCEGVVVRMGEVEVKERFYLFELGGVDIILGVAWLATLGEVTINWGTLAMRFRHEGQKVTIHGDPTLTQELVSLAALLKVREVEAITVIWNLGLTEWEEGSRGEKQLTQEQKGELEKVLGEYGEVFQASQGLPPIRKWDHMIPIKEAIQVPLYDEIRSGKASSRDAGVRDHRAKS